MQVRVAGVALDPAGQHVILLKPMDEIAGSGFVLPIWIGEQEATSILVAIEGAAVPRPLAHDLMRGLLEALDAVVTRVEVTRIDGGTFYAAITVTTAFGDRVVDSRPSDAIALASRVGAPIWVADAVMTEAGVLDTLVENARTTMRTSPTSTSASTSSSGSSTTSSPRTSAEQPSGTGRRARGWTGRKGSTMAEPPTEAAPVPASPSIDRTLDGGAVLRAARSGDEPGILACIQGLADYEREPDAVLNTAEALAETLFGDDPRASAHVVEHEGEIVGIAIWFVTYSTWTGRHGIWLEDLFVFDRYRGRGFGRALISSLAVGLRRAWIFAPGMDGAGLERSVHRVLPIPRRPPHGGVDDPAPHRRRPGGSRAQLTCSTRFTSAPVSLPAAAARPPARADGPTATGARTASR